MGFKKRRRDEIAPEAPHRCGATVKRVPMLRRRPLVEVGPDDESWSGSYSAAVSDIPEGAIVRLRPPAESVFAPAEVAQRLRDRGMLVRVAPAEVADAAVPREERRAVQGTHREVVLQLAGDDEAVRALVEEVCGEVGL